MTRKIKLYHYKPLSTVEQFTHLLNYMKQKAWFTRLDEFNDLFEARFHMKTASAQEILENEVIFNDYYRRFSNENPTLSENEFRAELKKPEASKMLGNIRLDNSPFHAYGTICLTIDPSNIPMWAHYANNHHGYCVVFEIDFDEIYKKYKIDYSCKDFDEMINKIIHPEPDGSNHEILSFSQTEEIDKKYIFTKIIYKEHRPIMNEVKLYELKKKTEYERNKYLSQNSFGVKYEQWGYEKEYRLIVNVNSKECGLMDLRGYPFIKITGIILGCNIGKNLSKDALDFIHGHELSGSGFDGTSLNEKVKEFIAKLAQKYGIKVYFGECSDEKYEIRDKEYIQ